eukprot:s3033_g6.t1
MMALEDRLFSQFFPSGMLGGQAEGSTAPPSESLDNDGSLRGQPAAKFADSQTDRKVTMPKRRMRMIRGPHGGRSKRGWETWGQGHNSADQKGSLASLREELRQLEESVFHMQKLALRHEDYLCAFRPETSYAIFMRLESQPLSLAGFSSQPSTQETMKKLGWITDDSMDWCYLRCDAKSERLRPDTTREPLPHAKGIATVAAIHLLVSKTGPATRFHPSRKMEETMRGATITFSMQLALFGDEAQQLRQYMYELTSCSIAQLLKGPPAPMWPMRSRRRCKCRSD